MVYKTWDGNLLGLGGGRLEQPAAVSPPATVGSRCCPMAKVISVRASANRALPILFPLEIFIFSDIVLDQVYAGDD